MMKKNIGAILAGGKGSRMGYDIPKQFLQIAGKTILEHTITAFQEHPLIDEIAIVADPLYFPRIRESILKFGFTKVKQLLEGGAERYHSSLSVLKAYETTDCNLLIHDAVRPLVSGRIIREVIGNLSCFQAVNVAIPVTDTIIEMDPDQGCIRRIPPRDLLYQVQTPQGFNRTTLAEAFTLALQDPDFRTTDDCSVVKKYLPDEKIKIVPGDTANIKVTWPEDLPLIQKFLTQR